MKQTTSAEPILQEGLAYTIYLCNGRKVAGAIYNACVASGKPYFSRGDETYPAEEVVRHSIAGRSISAECCQKDESETEIPSLATQIKSLLRTLGTKELNMDAVENSSMALWWDNHGHPNETTVLAVGIDDKDDLYLTLDDDCGGDVQIWESCGHLSDNDLELVLENIREYMARRSDPDRVAITDDVDEVVEVITTPTINSEMFRRRVKCLMLSGLSQEKAEQTIATTPLKLSLFYDIGRGAFAIDAEAVGNATLYNPYTGKEIPDETE